MNSTNHTQCPFCNLQLPEEVIGENATFVAKYDRYPVSQGHVLLIPKRHTESFFEMTDEELHDFSRLLREARRTILAKYSPDGFNIGINDGSAAGQTIPHLHIHLIPRYQGDVEHPEGGVRKLIPNLISYPPESDV